MSFFLRQLWKQKPQAYGPVSAVQRDIWMNAERCGIDPGSIVLYLPMWGPGDQVDYINTNEVINYNCAFKNNALLMDGSTAYLKKDISNADSFFSSLGVTGYPCTVIMNANITGFYNDYLFCKYLGFGLRFSSYYFDVFTW